MNGNYQLFIELDLARKRAGQALHSLIWPALCLTVAMVAGCGTATVQDTIYLQHVEADGPVNQPPIHVTTHTVGDKNSYITPRVSINSNNSISGSLQPQYSGKVPDTIRAFKSKGLDWKIPSVQLGFDLDYAFSDNKAFMFGVNQSVVNQQSLWGGYAGIGFYGRESTPIRLDLGLQFQQISYQAATILNRTETPLFGRTTTSTYYFVDRGKDLHVNFFGSFTVNGASKERSANPFFQVAVSSQTLTSFSPGTSETEEWSPLWPFYNQVHTTTDQRAESNAFWLHAVPGVYFNVGEANRVLLGLRISGQVGLENSNPSFLITPVMQFDWKL